MSPHRRDPRAERAAVMVPAARLRLDRAYRGGAIPAAIAVHVAVPAPIAIADPAFLLFAVVEAAGGSLSRHDRQVIGAARSLDTGGAAVVLIAPGPVADAGQAGADRLMILSDRGYDPAGSAAIIARAIAEHAPHHVIFAESDQGGDLARRVAVTLGEPLFDAVESLSVRQAIRPACAHTREFRAAPPRLLTIAADIIAPWHRAPHALSPIETPELVNPGPGFLAVEPLATDAATIPLDQAALVIAAGNGVTDFVAFRALAAAIGATPGASRVVCDAGLLPRALQVGASGTVLNADCYIALGISGAPQHLQGLGRVDHIIAINTDLHAAIIARAGLAIIADAQDVMRALLDQLR